MVRMKPRRPALAELVDPDQKVPIEKTQIRVDLAREDSKPLRLFCKYLSSVFYEDEARKRWLELEGQLLHCAVFLERQSTR